MIWNKSIRPNPYCFGHPVSILYAALLAAARGQYCHVFQRPLGRLGTVSAVSELSCPDLPVLLRIAVPPGVQMLWFGCHTGTVFIYTSTSDSAPGPCFLGPSLDGALRIVLIMSRELLRLGHRRANIFHF